MCISVRTLYRYIDDGIFLKLTNAHLPVKGKAKKKEKQKPVQKRASAGVSIEKRPEEIMTREEFGHWEMDTVKGKRGVTKSCLLVLSERKTRNEIVIKMPDQGAASVVASLDMLEESGENYFRLCLSRLQSIMVLSFLILLDWSVLVCVLKKEQHFITATRIPAGSVEQMKTLTS